MIFLLLLGCVFELLSNIESKKNNNKLQKSNIELKSEIIESRSEINETYQLLKSLGYQNPNPTKENIQQSLAADTARTQIARSTSSESRQQITVRYYPKDVDGDIVKSALLELDFKFTEGQPGIPDVGTNAIFFGDKVPIEDVKLVALTLIRAGVEIKYIRPFKNSTGRSLLIQVGAGTAYVSRQPLSVEAITDAESFPIVQ